jgi:peroxiredoxin
MVNSEQTHPPRKGTKAPDFTLDQVDGTPIKLGEILEEGQSILLIFLRYLG